MLPMWFLAVPLWLCPSGKGYVDATELWLPFLFPYNTMAREFLPPTNDTREHMVAPTKEKNEQPARDAISQVCAPYTYMPAKFFLDESALCSLRVVSRTHKQVIDLWTDFDDLITSGGAAGVQLEEQLEAEVVPMEPNRPVTAPHAAAVTAAISTSVTSCAVQTEPADDQFSLATIHDWSSFATTILAWKELHEELDRARHQLNRHAFEHDDPRARKAEIVLRTSHQIISDSQQTLQQRLLTVRGVWPPRDANVRNLLLPDEPTPEDQQTQDHAEPAEVAEPANEDKEFQRRRKKQRKKVRKDQAQVTLCAAAIRRHCYAAAVKASTSGIMHETEQPVTAPPTQSSHSDFTCNAASGHNDGPRGNKSRTRRPPCGRSLSILPLCHSLCLLFYLVATATVHLQPVRNSPSYSAVRSRSLHQTIGSPAAHEPRYSLQQPEQQQPHKTPQQREPPAADPSGAGITWTKCWASTDEVYWCEGVGNIKGLAPLNAQPSRWSWSPKEGLRAHSDGLSLSESKLRVLGELVTKVVQEAREEKTSIERDGLPLSAGDRSAADPDDEPPQPRSVDPSLSESKLRVTKVVQEVREEKINIVRDGLPHIAGDRSAADPDTEPPQPRSVDLGADANAPAVLHTLCFTLPEQQKGIFKRSFVRH